jgi:tetratricopeptide (TPR) repeat protein
MSPIKSAFPSTIKRIYILAFIFTPLLFFSQEDSLLSLLNKLPPLKTSFATDTSRLGLLIQLSEVSEESSGSYATQALELASSLSAEAKAGDQRIINIRKAAALNNLGIMYKDKGEIELAMKYYRSALSLQEKYNYPEGIAYSLNNIGLVYDKKGEILNALEYYSKSLAIMKELNKQEGIAQSLNNIGTVYYSQGDILKALDYYSQSLVIYEKIGDENGISYILNNIAIIYSALGDIRNALNYNFRSLKIKEAHGDKKSIAISLNNIGSLFKKQGDTKQALEYYIKSLEISEAIGYKAGMAAAYNNIGMMYKTLGDPAKGLEYGTKSLVIRKTINDRQGISYTMNSISAIYFSMKKYQLAMAYSDSSLAISRELGFPENIRNAELSLARIDSARGDLKGAFIHYSEYIKYRDSLANRETRKAGLRNQLKYEFDKKEALLKEQQEKERTLAREKSTFRKVILVSSLTGLLLVLAFAVYIYRSFKTTRRQKTVIEQKQREILDSINYAKRIQRTLLPNEKYIQFNLKRLSKR